MPRCRNRDVTVLAAALATLACSAVSLRAQTDPNGWITNWLTAIGYEGNCNPGDARRAEDHLCDGSLSESDIVPEVGLVIGEPVAVAEDCTGSKPPALVPFHAMARLDQFGALPITEEVATGRGGEGLDLDAISGGADDAMAYAWVYVENVTGSTLNLIGAIASDDSIAVDVNRVEVFSLGACRGWGGAGVVQNRFPVGLLPGGNLVQIKVWDGCCGWGAAMRLEDPGTCSPVVSGAGQIEVTTTPIPLAQIEARASRAISTAVRPDGTVVADVTLSVDSTQPFGIVESFDRVFSASNLSPAGSAAAGEARWTDLPASTKTVSYRLTATEGFAASDAAIGGSVTAGGVDYPISGETQVAGGVTPYVSELLVTPPIAMPAAPNACAQGEAEIQGGWISDGIVTDESIVPAEGLVVSPDFAGASQGLGWHAGLPAANQGRFWTAPGDAAATDGVLARVAADSSGLYDWRRPDVYGQITDAMCVAYFYAVNNTAEVQFREVGFGSDDSGLVRVNGRPAWTAIGCRGDPGYADKFVIALDPGKNSISFAVFQAGGGYTARLRFEEGGIELPVRTTLDPSGYDPDPAVHPVHELPGLSSGVAGAYSRAGFVTRFLVPADPFDQAIGPNTNPGAAPEDYLTVGDPTAPPALGEVRAGAPVYPGSSGLITTSVRGNACGQSELVLFDGVRGPTATAGDPGLFDGDAFYAGADNYGSTGFFYLENKTGGDVTAFIGFASDDAASLFIDGALVLEHLTNRGFGGANQIQTGPAEVSLPPGASLVQLSYNDGTAGSGFRVGLWQDCEQSKTFDPEVLEVSANPPGARQGLRSITTTVAGATVTADVTLTVTGAGPYTLTETLLGGDGWSASGMSPPASSSSGGVITWRSASASTISYRLTRSTPFSSEEGRITGEVEVGGIASAVSGDEQIDGGRNPWVERWLVLPSLDLGARQGCTISFDDLQLPWIGDGAGTTDANVVPAAGEMIDIAFDSAASAAAGLDEDLTDAARAEFWGPAGEAVWVEKDANASGTIDYNGTAGIFGADVNVAVTVGAFYALNESGAPLDVVLEVGTDDSALVRVNGFVVHVNPICRGVPPMGSADKVPVTLDPGSNLVLVYAFQNAVDHGARARFESAEGTGIYLPTTTDPSGYAPAGHARPAPAPAPPEPPGVYTDLGFVTRFLVPSIPFAQLLGPDSTPGAFPEDYITVNFDGALGDIPSAERVLEGAHVGPGSSGLVTTGFHADFPVADTCGFARLVLFDGVSDPTATAGDPGLFDGDAFYGGTDQYSSTLFFFVNNKTGADLEAYFAFASDDSASLFVNGALEAEHLGGRGFGGANTLQDFAREATFLEAGDNLVQLSYNDGGGGSGARVAVFADCAFSETFAPEVAEISPLPSGDAGGSVRAARSLGGLSCQSEVEVEITFSVEGGGSAGIDLVEELPAGGVGSSASRGSFDGDGSVLTFQGQISDGDTITYTLSDVAVGDGYCAGTVGERPIVGDTIVRSGPFFCGDIADGLYINCGAGELTDALGRVWSEDSIANPSSFLTSPNAHTNTFGPFAPPLGLGGIDMASDPLVGEEQYPAEVFPSERWNDGPVEYTIQGLPAGCYDVTLLFMEGCCSDGCEDLPDPEDSAGGCRVFDVYLNGELVEDQFAQKVVGARLAGVSPAGAASDGIALARRYTVSSGGTIVVLIDDLGGGDTPQNAAIKAVAIEPARDPGLCAAIGTPFKRGDADSSGGLNITDGIFVLNFLFLGGPTPSCRDAADADDSGGLNITDGIYLLNFLFLGGPAPKAPGEKSCGADPSGDDGLPCDSYDGC